MVPPTQRTMSQHLRISDRLLMSRHSQPYQPPSAHSTCIPDVCDHVYLTLYCQISFYSTKNTFLYFSIMWLPALLLGHRMSIPLQPPKKTQASSPLFPSVSVEHLTKSFQMGFTVFCDYVLLCLSLRIRAQELRVICFLVLILVSEN